MKPHCTWLVYLPWFYTFVWLCRFVCVAVWCVDNREGQITHTRHWFWKDLNKRTIVWVRTLCRLWSQPFRRPETTEHEHRHSGLIPALCVSCR